MAIRFCSISLFVLILWTATVLGDLKAGFYDQSCPRAELIVKNVLSDVVQKTPRTAAFLLRMHFHDCFVNGCDGSVLLDDIASFTGEKKANPNVNSLKGFEVVDAIKTALEKECPQVVSCADILAIAARDSVVLAGGPSWEVRKGRRDSRRASLAAANRDIPAPNSTLSQLVAKFQRKGLSAKEMVVLSGSHTIGRARCSSITQRLYNFHNRGKTDPTIEPLFLGRLQQLCTPAGDGNVTAPLDLSTPLKFDNGYYKNLQANRGLLSSDQALQLASTKECVLGLAGDEAYFFREFAAAMVKMGNIGPKTGNTGEIRTHCRYVN